MPLPKSALSSARRFEAAAAPEEGTERVLNIPLAFSFLASFANNSKRAKRTGALEDNVAAVPFATRFAPFCRATRGAGSVNGFAVVASFGGVMRLGDGAAFLAAALPSGRVRGCGAACAASGDTGVERGALTSVRVLNCGASVWFPEAFFVVLSTRFCSRPRVPRNDETGALFWGFRAVRS
jgi:hypothetical protein